MDSGNKGCENKGMRFKIPCKNDQLPGFSGLILSLLLSMASIAVANDVGQEADHALFWSIQKSGQPAGYLLGTIHSEDPRVLD